MEKKIELGLIELPIITYHEDDMYISEVPVINVASQGKTIEESITNLKEAVELYFEGENVKKIIEEKFPIPSVMTTTMTFNINTKQVVRLPISV
jgi:predicted RNase H-like HicB family nuclease